MNLFNDSKTLILVVFMLLLPSVFYLLIISKPLRFDFYIHQVGPIKNGPQDPGPPDFNNNDNGSDDSVIECAVQGCHGLPVTCGPSKDLMCTEVYMLGDGCRNIAKCEKISNSCVMTNNSAVQKCSECVQKCITSDAETDMANPRDKFSCEQKCIQLSK